METTQTTATKEINMSRYTLSDGNAHETYDTFAECREAAAEWYDYLLAQTEDDATREDFRRILRDTDLAAKIESAKGMDELKDAVSNLETALAKVSGHKDFAGHGHYFVRAVDQAGFSLGIDRE